MDVFKSLLHLFTVSWLGSLLTAKAAAAAGVYSKTTHRSQAFSCSHNPHVIMQLRQKLDTFEL